MLLTDLEHRIKNFITMLQVIKRTLPTLPDHFVGMCFLNRYGKDITLTIGHLQLFLKGCTLWPTSVMEKCCVEINSTTVYIGNNSFACPFSGGDATEDAWRKCLAAQFVNTTSICRSPDTPENRKKFGHVDDTNIAVSLKRSRLLTLILTLLLVGMLTHV